jgi:hypothetical protein
LWTAATRVAQRRGPSGHSWGSQGAPRARAGFAVRIRSISASPRWRGEQHVTGRQKPDSSRTAPPDAAPPRSGKRPSWPRITRSGATSNSRKYRSSTARARRSRGRSCHLDQAGPDARAPDPLRQFTDEQVRKLLVRLPPVSGRGRRRDGRPRPGTARPVPGPAAQTVRRPPRHGPPRKVRRSRAAEEKDGRAVRIRVAGDHTGRGVHRCSWAVKNGSEWPGDE